MKAQLQMSDCVSMQGNVLINIDARVSEFLNASSEAFLPFEPEDGSTHLLNKFNISRLMPLGDVI